VKRDGHQEADSRCEAQSEEGQKETGGYTEGESLVIAQITKGGV